MPDDKDIAQAALQNMHIKPGQRFRHYKGGEYEVINLAVKEDTLEPLVIYRSLLKGYAWARTLSNWNESVMVKGKLLPRFRKLD